MGSMRLAPCSVSHSNGRFSVSELFGVGWHLLCALSFQTASSRTGAPHPLLTCPPLTTDHSPVTRPKKIAKQSAKHLHPAMGPLQSPAAENTDVGQGSGPVRAALPSSLKSFSQG